MAAVAGRADAPCLARKRHHEPLAAARAPRAGKSEAEDAALEIVTESHKDFCANTMFRWDLFAKEPRAMPDAAARIRDADDIWYRVARPGITLPHSVNLGLVTSTVQGKPYAALLSMLG